MPTIGIAGERPLTRPYNRLLGSTWLAVFSLWLFFIGLATPELHSDASIHIKNSAPRRAEATVQPRIQSNSKQHPKSTASVATNAKQDTGIIFRNPGSTSAGQTYGRSLSDWEMEDFVLLASADGTMYARDRRTGDARWQLHTGKKLVETIFHGEGDRDGEVYLVEPSAEGTIYSYTPGDKGLSKLEISMRSIIDEFSPFHNSMNDNVYLGSKSIKFFSIDSKNGRILYSSESENSVQPNESCRKKDGLEDLDDECNINGAQTVRRTIQLGRTDYEVYINSHTTGKRLWTLKYSEWGPNNRDRDLWHQYHESMDDKFIYPHTDGRVVGFYKREDQEAQATMLFQRNFPHTIVRVFDVVRPISDLTVESPLVLLAQPLHSEDDPQIVEDYVFVNRTEFGAWFAMSQRKYPLVKEMSHAPCYNYDNPYWEASGLEAKNLIGKHPLKTSTSNQGKIGQGTLDAPLEPGVVPGNSSRIPDHDMPGPSDKARSEDLPIHDTSGLRSVAVPSALTLLFLILGYSWFKNPDVYSAAFNRFRSPSTVTYTLEHVNEQIRIAKIEAREEAAKDALRDADSSSLDADAAQDGHPVDVNATPTPKSKGARVTFADDLEPDQNGETQVGTPKKRSRGKRGGAKRKAKKAAETQESADDLEVIVETARAIEPEPKLEPDVVVGASGTVMKASQQADTNDLKDLNGLKFSTANFIGHGSSGTTVYKGEWEGREVAVKRVMGQFYDIAQHEIDLLVLSDNHPNVVRYFTMREEAEFYYIALELCCDAKSPLLSSDTPPLPSSVHVLGSAFLPLTPRMTWTDFWLRVTKSALSCSSSSAAASPVALSRFPRVSPCRWSSSASRKAVASNLRGGPSRRWSSEVLPTSRSPSVDEF